MDTQNKCNYNKYNKKLKLTYFHCICNKLFFCIHRISENHNCKYNCEYNCEYNCKKLDTKK